MRVKTRDAGDPCAREEAPHGELLITNELLQVLEFVLVAMLGFMPLTVIHWADRRPPLHLPLSGRLSGHRVAARAALITLASAAAVWVVL